METPIASDACASGKRRRGGRKPLSPSEPSAPVSVKLPLSMFERAAVAARRERLDGIPALMRLALARYLRQSEI